MTWSYNSSLLLSTSSTNADLMRVRYLVQDVTSSTQLVQNEEINWVLSIYPNVWRAASEVAGSIATHFAKMARSKSVGSLSIQWGERAKEFKERASSLKAQSETLRTFSVYAGGISVADKNAHDDDTDWDKPAFARGMHDFPGANMDPEWVSPRSST